MSLTPLCMEWFEHASDWTELSSLLIGVHLFLSRQWAYFAIHLVIFLAAVISFSRYTTIVADRGRICCYEPSPPSAFAYAQGGACNDPYSNVRRAGDVDMSACEEYTTSEIVLLSVGIGCTVLLPVAHYVGRKLFLRECNRLYLEKQFGTLARMARESMFLPIKSILFRRYEHYLGHQVLFWVGCITTILTIICGCTSYNEFREQNAWACYTEVYYTDTPAFYLTLENGMCDDPQSAQYFATDGGQYNSPWVAYIIFIILTVLFGITSIVLFVGRLIGMGKSILPMEMVFMNAVATASSV